MNIKRLPSDPTCPGTRFEVFVSAMETDYMGKAIAEQVIHLIAEHVAAVYVEEHATEILAKINPEAVAAMAIAEAGAALNDTLKKQHADRVVRVPVPGETQVYQKGIFGGLRRLR